MCARASPGLLGSNSVTIPTGCDLLCTDAQFRLSLSPTLGLIGLQLPSGIPAPHNPSQRWDGVLWQVWLEGWW